MLLNVLLIFIHSQKETNDFLQVYTKRFSFCFFGLSTNNELVLIRKGSKQFWCEKYLEVVKHQHDNTTLSNLTPNTKTKTKANEDAKS